MSCSYEQGWGPPEQIDQPDARIFRQHLSVVNVNSDYRQQFIIAKLDVG